LSEDDDIFKHQVPNINFILDSLKSEEIFMKELYLKLLKNLLRDYNTAVDAVKNGLLLLIPESLKSASDNIRILSFNCFFALAQAKVSPEFLFECGDVDEIVSSIVLNDDRFRLQTLSLFAYLLSSPITFTIIENIMPCILKNIDAVVNGRNYKVDKSVPLEEEARLF
jgi:hypothetical protein